VGISGSSSYDAGSDTFTIQGGGSGIGEYQDSFRFVYAPALGNSEIITHVVSQTNASSYAAAGVMMRETLDVDSAFAAITVSPSNGLIFTYRSAKSHDVGTVVGPNLCTPVWLRLVRSGTSFAGYESTDGENWVLAGKATFSMSNSFSAGMTVSSGGVEHWRRAFLTRCRNSRLCHRYLRTCSCGWGQT